MGSNPHANGGLLLRDLRMPDFREYAVEVAKPGASYGEATRVLGTMLRDVMKLNMADPQFPGLRAGRDRVQPAERAVRGHRSRIHRRDFPVRRPVSPDGRVLEVLSEHMCEGWLEGYLLTGRHGLFSCYEGFIHIIDSMFNQHAKWLKVSRIRSRGGVRSRR